MRIALATCAHLPEPDHDEAPTLAALRAAGHEAAPLPWDDPAADPAAFDVVVLRATWNYPQHVEAFCAWLDRTAQVTTLLNPADVVRWNLHKRYLLELAAAGVPIVPTRFVDRGATTDLAALLAETGWTEFVVKPAISAGSWLTRAFTADQVAEAQAFLDQLTAERDAMVQRFMGRVRTDPERAIVWIDGAVSHVLHKALRLADDDEAVTGGLVADADERAIAEQVMEALPAGVAERLLYARVDVMPDDDGRLVLSELEVCEPSLFFPKAPQALARFVAGVERLGLRPG